MAPPWDTVFPGGLNDSSSCIFVGKKHDNVQFKYRLFKVFGEHSCCLGASVVFVTHFH